MNRIACIVGVLAVAASGCSLGLFSDLSDLEDQIFVDIAGQPGGVNSQEYPVGVAWAGGNGDGLKIAAIGNEIASASANIYDANGTLSQEGNNLTDLAAWVANRPPIIGDPGAEKLILAARTNNNLTVGAVLRADQGITTGVEVQHRYDLLDHDGNEPTAVAIGLVRGTTTAADLLVGGGNQQLSIVEDYAGDDASEVIVSCDITDDPIGLATAELDGVVMGEEILIGFGGRVEVVPQTAFDAVAPCSLDLETNHPSIEPPRSVNGFGQQIAVADFNDNGNPDIVVGSADGVFIYLDRTVDTSDGTATITSPNVEIDPPDGASSAFAEQIVIADFNNDGTPDLAVSDHEATVDGAANAGRVLFYEIQGTSSTDPVVLHAFEPEADQQFGFSIEAAEFGSTGNFVLAATVGEEVFTYFRTNLDGSADPRAGR